jgi:3',5'-cyclic AMP phosphodiesterase CpdA
MKIIKTLLLYSFALAPFPAFAGGGDTAGLRILAIADIQYSQDDPRMRRYYRNSIPKLEQIRKETEKQDFDFLVNLGDIIDNKYENLAPVLAGLDRFKMPKYHILGNHDFADSPKNILSLIKDLNLETRAYYILDKGPWRFVFLDTNTLGNYYNVGDETLKQEAAKALEKTREAGTKNAKLWNGGLDKRQLAWLDRQLADGGSRGMKVVIFAHSPLLPFNSHSALNTGEILEVIFKYSCVKAYICGHNHKGGYETRNGVPFLTLSGLVEGESEASYAELELHDSKIVVRGHGRTGSHVFSF